jgi:DHA1 family tetracycline resistance protein-like MFS transporter
LFYAVGFVLFGIAEEGWMMYLFLIPYCLGGIAMPSLQGIMSNQVPSNEQGELQGALTSLMSITSAIGPLLMTGLFYYYSDDVGPYFPGAAMIAGAVLTVISAGLARFNLKKNLVGKPVSQP